VHDSKSIKTVVYKYIFRNLACTVGIQQFKLSSLFQYFFDLATIIPTLVKIPIFYSVLVYICTSDQRKVSAYISHTALAQLKKYMHQLTRYIRIALTVPVVYLIKAVCIDDIYILLTCDTEHT